MTVVSDLTKAFNDTTHDSKLNPENITATLAKIPTTWGMAKDMLNLLSKITVSPLWTQWRDDYPEHVIWEYQNAVIDFALAFIKNTPSLIGVETSVSVIASYFKSGVLADAILKKGLSTTFHTVDAPMVNQLGYLALSRSMKK